MSEKQKKIGDVLFYVSMISCLIFDLNLVFQAKCLNVPISTFELVLALFMTTFYIYVGHQKNIEFFREETLKKILIQDIYFHGFRIWRYLSSGAFIRMQEWYDGNMHYELSALAMIYLLKIRSARICLVSCYDEKENFQGHYSWVEFKIPLNGWWVADFSQIPNGFAPKKSYLEDVLEDGYSIVYEDIDKARRFKKYTKIQQISKAMLDSKTSNVFLELSSFSNPNCKISTAKLHTEGSIGAKMPVHLCNEKPMSTDIIQDFVKNPKRRQPTKRTLRKALSMMRKDPQ